MRENLHPTIYEFDPTIYEFVVMELAKNNLSNQDIWKVVETMKGDQTFELLTDIWHRPVQDFSAKFLAETILDIQRAVNTWRENDEEAQREEGAGDVGV